jgi:raffinose/stachyose/melibiose transport system substrate-binding protein
MTKGFKVAVAVAGGLAMTLAFGVASPAAASTAPTEPPGSAAAPAELNNGENVTLKLLADNTETTSLLTAGLTSAFSALHPNVTFDIEQRPGGADGDNIVKTRLATNEMADVFFYNSGSLLQALNPTETLVDLSGDPMLDNVVDAFIPTVSQGDGVFGVPFGTGLGGGILYNRSIFEDNGLSVPKTWAEFEANNAALLDAGITPVGASYGTTWTSQLFVLADFYNLSQADPDFAEQYTANEAHYADTPAALLGFQRLQEGYDEGWWNEDYGSATYEDALQMLIDGDIAQYPMLTFALSEIAAIDPEAAQNIGFFGQPGPDAATNGMTLWMPAAAYIAATTEHEDVARAFLAFIASVEGTEAQTAAAAPGGPYLIEGASLPDDVLPAVDDVQAYIDAGNVGPALEFLSPLKGPNLEKITVEVGSGLRSAEDAAALYDQDVEKEAQQLDLPGW